MIGEGRKGMRDIKIPPFLVSLFLIFVFAHSKFFAEEIPLPDTAPPSRPPSEVGDDYGNGGCNDWRLHYQCHFRQGYPGQYGGSYLT